MPAEFTLAFQKIDHQRAVMEWISSRLLLVIRLIWFGKGLGKTFLLYLTY